MKLEVGEFYLSASGEVVKITGCGKGELEDTNFNKYNLQGIYIKGYRSNDLIAHIPKGLHYKIIDIIKDYYTIPMIRDSINNSYEKRRK